MNDLVLVHNNQAVVSSRTVAEHFEKEHKTVLRNIKEIVKAQNCALAFYEEHQYKVQGQYRSYPEYYMNRDGFMLLVMGFTTKPAMQVKIAFIKAFNEMEAKLKKQSIGNATLDDYNRNIQRLMNENDKLKAKLKACSRHAILGWTVENLSRNDKILQLSASFVEGCLEA